MMPRKCPHCGYSNQVDANFCGGCGVRLVEAAAASSRLAGAIAAMTPRHLAEQILQVRSELQGARKLVTVMFADILGSFELMGGRDPEAVGVILDDIIELMVDGVHRYEGTVTQVLGDGIMALFGAPIAHEDHAVRAAYAALDIHASLERSCERQVFPEGVKPKLRIGLNSGEVVIRAIGNDLSLDYRAVGPTTHMAARMEQMAVPGTTRLTAQTASLAEGLIETSALGEISVKGVSEPVRVFELVSTTGQSRFSAHVSGGLTPFIGREDEFRLLEASIRDVMNGIHRSILVEGEAGIGKSRLCYEFVERIKTADVILLEASAVAYHSRAYGMLGDLLRSLLMAEPSDTSVRLRERLDEKFDELHMSDHFRAALASVLDLDVDDREWARLDPAQRRYLAFEAMRALFEQLGTSKGLVLFCEDLHWVDSESFHFIESLLKDPPCQRMLLLLTFRPEFTHDWSISPGVRVCRLTALSEAARRTLILRMIGKEPGLEALRNQLAAVTDGNPFFIEESIRSLAEAAILSGQFGNYRLGKSLDQLHIPPSIESVVAARIDRLSAPQKELLQAAAGVGSQMLKNELMLVANLTDEVLASRLEKLISADMLSVTAESTPSMVRFKHAMVHDVAYRSMLREQRRELHERILRVLESLYEQRIAEQVDRLADHAFRGELWSDAAHYCMQACRRAADRSANREAAGALERGLSALEHLPDDRNWIELGIDLRLRVMETLLPLGDKKRMIALLRESEDMSRRINDERRLGAALTQLSTALWINAEHELALKSGEAALELARKHNSVGLQDAALHAIASVHHARGEFSGAIEIGRKLVADYGGELAYRRFGWAGYPSVFCRTFLASALTFIGDFGEATEVFETALGIADEVEHPYSQTIVREEYAYALLWLDRTDDALNMLNDAMEICRAYDVYTMYPAICGRLAVALAECGRSDEAISLALDAYERETYKRAGRYALNFLLTGLGKACLHQNQLQDALDWANQAERLTGGAGERAHNACALALVADVESARGDREEAVRSYSKACGIARASGMRPLEAQCRLGLAEARLRAGATVEAVEEFHAAARLFDAVGLKNQAAGVRSRLEAA